MSLPSRVAPRLRSLQRAIPTSARPFTSTVSNRKDEQWPQRIPIGKFYESILDHPTPYPFDQKPEEPPNSADPNVLPEEKEPVPVKKPEPTKTEEKKTEEKKPEAKEKKPAKAPAEKPPKKKPGRKPKDTTTTASAAPSEATSPPSLVNTPATPEEKVRIIFGTRFASPDDKEARLALKANSSTYIAGIMVPPEPAEPDNCCMSGCVNCVWDLYREDMEEFTAKKLEAHKRLNAQSGSKATDGGGSETTWNPPKGVEIGEAKIAKDLWDDDVFKNVPVGIREFMKQEKRLKERHEREGTVG